MIGIELASFSRLLFFLHFDNFLGIDVGFYETGECGGFGGGEVLGCAEEGADACVGGGWGGEKEVNIWLVGNQLQWCQRRRRRARRTRIRSKDFFV